MQGGFIVGFDNDSASIFQQQIDFIQKSGIVTAMVGLLQAPPGTHLYQRMKREGRLLKDISGDNVDGSTNIIPRMGLDPCGRGIARSWSQIYTPKFYYGPGDHISARIPASQDQGSWEPQYILALGRSIFRIGHPWRRTRPVLAVLFLDLFRRPRLFPLAITLSIYGFPFPAGGGAARHINANTGLKILGYLK